VRGEGEGEGGTKRRPRLVALPRGISALIPLYSRVRGRLLRGVMAVVAVVAGPPVGRVVRGNLRTGSVPGLGAGASAPATATAVLVVLTVHAVGNVD
jgi:hypothetical protein